MNSKPENRNMANESQSYDGGAAQDLPIQTLNEADADYAEEIKGGTVIKKAVLTVRKTRGEQSEY